MKDLNLRKSHIEAAWENVELLKDTEIQESVIAVLRALEQGNLRVISPQGMGADCGSVPMLGDLRTWEVHAWVKQAILLAIKWRHAEPIGHKSESGISPSQGRVHGSSLQYFDKFDARSDFAAAGIRVVPPGMVREGAFLASGTIVMPGFVNIGARVETGSMVDTWATVGSCAQVGANVHLAGGVGIGGVLEPANARPVLIGDNAFVGSRAIVVEGAVISAGAVLGANVCITSSTPIYDVTVSEKVEYKGYVPPNAVVAPGTRPRMFPGGEVQLQCAYIIGYRKPSTDAKVSLNAVLRETGLTV